MAGLADLAGGADPLSVLTQPSAGPLMRAQALQMAAGGPQSGFSPPGGLSVAPLGGSRPSPLSGLTTPQTDTKLPPAPPAPEIDHAGALDSGAASAADHLGRIPNAGLDFANPMGSGALSNVNAMMQPTSQDKNLALAQAGFAMMGSSSPWFGQALGQGASAGLEALQRRMAQRAEAALRIAQLQKESQQLQQQMSYQNSMLGMTQQQRDLQAKEQELKAPLIAAQIAAERERAAHEHAQTMQLNNPFAALGGLGGGGGASFTSTGSVSTGGGGATTATVPPPPAAPIPPGAKPALSTAPMADATPVQVPEITTAMEGVPGLKGALIPVQDKTDVYKDTGDAPVQTGQLHLSDQGRQTWDHLPPAAQALVGAMLEGRMEAPRGFALGKSPMLASLVAVANQIDPTFDQANWNARVNLRKSVMGGGKQADNIAALRLFYQHIGQLDDDQKTLHNGDFAIGNNLQNAVAGQWQGYGADENGQTRSDVLAAIKKDTDLVSNEAMKVARGSGTPSEKEAESFRVGFSPTDAYHTSHAGNVRLAGLVQARMNAVNQQWKDTFGTTLPFNMLTPEAQKVHDSLAAPAVQTTLPRMLNDDTVNSRIWDSLKSGDQYIKKDGTVAAKP